MIRANILRVALCRVTSDQIILPMDKGFMHQEITPCAKHEFWAVGCVTRDGSAVTTGIKAKANACTGWWGTSVLVMRRCSVSRHQVPSISVISCL